MSNIYLLCFIRYNLGYLGHLGNRIVAYSSIDMVFAHRWPFKLRSLWILCNKWNFGDTPPGSLPRVPSLFHIPNGFTVKHRRSVKSLRQCDTNCAGHFTLNAHASRPVACLPHTWRCHDMETLAASVALCEGINQPIASKGPVMWSFDIFFVVDWAICRANSGVAGDSRCHDSHMTS